MVFARNIFIFIVDKLTVVFLAPLYHHSESLIFKNLTGHFFSKWLNHFTRPTEIQQLKHLLFFTELSFVDSDFEQINDHQC